MVKCSKTTLKYSNTNRLTDISIFIQEYHTITQQFVDILWEQKDIPKLIKNSPVK